MNPTHPTHLAHTIFQTAQIRLRAAIRTQLEFTQPFTDSHQLYCQVLKNSKQYQSALILLHTMVAVELRQQQTQLDSRRVARQKVKQFVMSLIDMEREREREHLQYEQMQYEQMEEEFSSNEQRTQKEKEIKTQNVGMQLEEKRQVRRNKQQTPKANAQTEVKTEDMSHFHSQSTRKEQQNKDYIALSSQYTGVDPVKLQADDVIEQSCSFGHFIIGDKLQLIKQIRKINEQLYVVVSWLPRQSQFQPFDSLLHSQCVNLYVPTELAIFCSNLVKKLVEKKKANT